MQNSGILLLKILPNSHNIMYPIIVKFDNLKLSLYNKDVLMTIFLKVYLILIISTHVEIHNIKSCLLFLISVKYLDFLKDQIIDIINVLFLFLSSLIDIIALLIKSRKLKIFLQIA